MNEQKIINVRGGKLDTTIPEMYSTIIYRMVHGVLPDNYTEIDVENETHRQRNYLDIYSDTLRLSKLSIDDFGVILQDILKYGGEDGGYFIEFDSTQESEDFILDLVSAFKLKLNKS